MKQIKGKPVNIEEDIVGRVNISAKICFSVPTKYGLIKTHNSAFGYVATITTKETITDNGSLIVWLMT